MKLVVPLMMPATHSMRLAVRPFAQRLDDGDATGHGGFEGHHHALVARRGEDLAAVHGQQRLVGGDHVLAGGNGLQHQRLGDAVAADQLDDDVDVGVGDDTARASATTCTASPTTARARSCPGRPPW
jgi:hypothetical protein